MFITSSLPSPLSSLGWRVWRRPAMLHSTIHRSIVQVRLTSTVPLTGRRTIATQPWMIIQTHEIPLLLLLLCFVSPESYLPLLGLQIRGGEMYLFSHDTASGLTMALEPDWQLRRQQTSTSCHAAQPPGTRLILSCYHADSWPEREREERLKCIHAW